MTKFTRTLQLSLAGLFTAGIVSLSGCADKDKPAAAAPAPAAEATPASATIPPKPVSLGQIKQELIETKTQIQTTTEALNKLQKSTPNDAVANYNTYSEQYLKLKAQAEAVKGRAADLKARASTYLATWTKQADVENPSLRKQAIQQKADAEKLVNTVGSEMELTRIEFAPYMANLTDVGKYLNKNLTPSALESTSELVTKATAQATSVNQHIDSVIAALDQLASSTGESPVVQPGPVPGSLAAPAN